MGLELGGEEKTSKFGNGLVVESFEAIPSTIFEGDQADLVLRVRNKGEPVAKEVKTYLYSYGDLSLENSNNKFRGHSKLDPPTDQFEGEVKDIEWTVNTSGLGLSGTQKETVDCYARIYYKYNTSAKVSVPVLNKDEYKKRVERDESLPSKGPVEVTHGPFAVEVKSRDPVLVENTQGEKTFKVYITARNTAGGTPYIKSGHPSNKNDRPSNQNLEEIQIKVDPGANADLVSCDGNTSWSGFGNVPVRRGERARLGCTLNVTSPTVPRQDVTVTTILSYGYYKDTSVPVTVEGEA